MVFGLWVLDFLGATKLVLEGGGAWNCRAVGGASRRSQLEAAWTLLNLIETVLIVLRVSSCFGMNDLGYSKFQRPRAKDSAKEGDVRTAFKTTGSLQAKTRHRLLHDLETTINALMTSLAYHLASFSHLYTAVYMAWTYISKLNGIWSIQLGEPRSFPIFERISMTFLPWGKWFCFSLSFRNRLRAERPNTADVGTFGLRQAAEELAMMRNTDSFCPFDVRPCVSC